MIVQQTTDADEQSRNAGLPQAVSQGEDCHWSWKAEQLLLLGQKALWRPAGGELFVADLHLGKAEVFQSCGIPLPSDGDRDTLERLEALCATWQPTRLIILGDLIHGPLGLTDRLRADLQTLDQRLNTDVVLVGGNHDRRLPTSERTQQRSFRLGALWLSHEPEPPSDGEPGLNLCGHVHPVTTVRQGPDRLRLPCFAYEASQERLLLPAFGALTGGHDCGQVDRKWLVAEGRVMAWRDPSSPSRRRRWTR
ncbi:ligase-associated DNA damage response endonuclease PdeM [Synechococcus sp. NOUM97013]|uniref:ligase-associated DNA damage response endonuclease PdeM n=1 Tax=Synechococcus sp. NOUM97013 TaxID=1442555 RepID=UPI0021041DDD|nr:ligase-associated DNA damage response endonuclease PdeM [Synechococcus sp. NOUM97013]